MLYLLWFLRWTQCICWVIEKKFLVDCRPVKLEPLIIMSSYNVFVITDYNQIIAPNKSRQDINQSILSNRSVDFHPITFCFPIIHHNSIFSTHVRRVFLFKYNETSRQWTPSRPQKNVRYREVSTIKMSATCPLVLTPWL